MSVRELIDAIASGDSLAVEQNFNAEMANRISERLDTMRIEVAKNMFKEQAEPVEEAEEVQEDELTLEDFSIEEIEEYMMSEEFEQLDEASKNTISSYVKLAKEEVEQIDELSSATLKSYKDKAEKSAADHNKKGASAERKADQSYEKAQMALSKGHDDRHDRHMDDFNDHDERADQHYNKAEKRTAGAKLASHKLDVKKYGKAWFRK